jgi:hypothetical protein
LEQELKEKCNEMILIAWKKFFWKVVGKLCEGIYLADIDEFKQAVKRNLDESTKNLIN